MASSEYKLLRQQDSDMEESLLSDSLPKQPPRLYRAAYTLLMVLFFISLFFNAIWVIQQRQNPLESIDATPTLYAGLLRNLAVPFTIDTTFTSNNRTIEDEAWKSPELVPDTGLVAISDDWVRSKNLPEAQRFPWDNSKGIYLLNGFHNIHCLHIIRQSILEAFDGKSQALRREHVTHCLNVLREDIVCNADDTPRYTGRVNHEASAEHPTSGVGQTRMCRDWSQLEQWAIEHSACYKAINANDARFPPIERYKFCPNGETLWP